MKKVLLNVVALMFLSVSVWAQKKISGKVTDEKGVPIAGASVVVKGTNVGTTTDANGNYTITAPEGSKVLLISFVGQANKEITIGSSATYNIQLAEAAGTSDDVVVLGYGTGKKVGTVVGSVTKVNAEVLESRPIANAMDGLQGRVAGLQIYTSSGEPSATSSARINGVSSLTSSNTPLYILDGVPVESSSMVAFNPQDFESVTVLRDASATAIYGSRAANGVIILESKKGSVSRPATITVQGQYGVSNMIKTTQDVFDGFMNSDELFKYWVQTGYRTQAQVDALKTTYPNDYKWYKAYYQEDVPMSQVNLSASGGAGKTTYFVSGNYFKQEGLAYRSGYDRWTMRANINTAVNKWLNMGVNLSGGYNTRETNPYGSNSLNFGLSMLSQPFYSLYDKDGNEYPELIPGLNRYNPRYLEEKITSKRNDIQLNPTAYLSISPIRNLVIKSQAGLEFKDQRTTNVTFPSYLGSLNNGNASESFARTINRTITNTAEYKFDLNNKHDFVLLAGQEYIDYNYNSMGGSGAGLTDDRLVQLTATTSNWAVSGYRDAYASNSYFGRLNYAFDKKYYVDLSLRQDQSSKFGKNLNSATFYSVGLLWDMKKEAFLENVDWLSNISLKASYGTSGNSFFSGSYYQNLALVGKNQYAGQTGFGITQAGNPDLSWEKVATTSATLSFELYKRARVEFNVFDRKTQSMLTSVPYPYTSGFSSITSNVGELTNKGFNFDFNYDVIKNKDFSLTPYVSVGYAKDKVTKLFQGKDFWVIPNTGVSWAIGKPISYYYPIFAGVNTETGMPEWYEAGENPGNTTKDKKTTNFSSSALQQNTGIRRYAPWTGGFGLNASYKGFSLETHFAFAKGKYLINNDRYFFENPNQFTGYNQSRVVMDYWKQPGDVARFPKYGQQFTQFDSRLIEDASFLRMKTISLGYTVPKSVLSKNNVVKGAKVYVSGRNLLTWTQYQGPDPEVDSNLSLGANPNTRQFVFGLDLTF